MRPPLRYVGNKYQLTSWITERIPDHENYVEVFGGSAAVLLNKDRSWKEVYNDRNGDLVTFFKVVRDRRGELEEWLRQTPHSREAYEEIATRFFEEEERPDDSVAHAGWVFYILQNGYGADFTSMSGFERPQMSESARKRSRARMYQNKVSKLEKVATRLRGVTLECADWREVLEMYDRPQTFFYLDPPYRGSEDKVNGSGFNHSEFGEKLAGLEASWMVSYGHVPEWADRYDVETRERRKGMASEITEVLVANYDMGSAEFTDIAQTNVGEWS